MLELLEPKLILLDESDEELDELLEPDEEIDD
jgi:SpoU rRNA methylase family enzyme